MILCRHWLSFLRMITAGAARPRFAVGIVHICLLFFVFLLFLPIYLALIAASHEAHAMLHSTLPIWPGLELLHNLKVVLLQGISAADGQPIWLLLINSFVMAVLIASGKIICALFSAFVLVYFKFPFRRLVFALIFITMLLPIEIRIIPTFQVVANLGLLNSFAGLSLPLMASATATFLFRQFFKTIPNELVDAATLDGASPVRFFLDILLPLSKTQVAALFIILFIYGWNQYLWPLIITTDSSMSSIVMGIKYLAGIADQIPQWNYIMTASLIALTPPCLIVISMQRWFERGLMH